MKNILLLIVLLFNIAVISVYGEDKPTSEPAKPKVNVSASKYSLNVTITGIPPAQQTLFIPINIDTMILDFDKVALESLSAQNILAVASNSKDKVGTGIGLIKIDESGLPPTLELKVLLKTIGEGETAVSLLKVADEPALLSKGVIISKDINVTLKSSNEIEVTEKQQGNKKKLLINQNKLTLNIQRPAQNEETIFIPLIFDKDVFDVDETFGHAIVGPGIAAKSFSSGSLHEGGPGVEIVLSPVAEKDFTIDVELIPRKVGKGNIAYAYVQRGHTALVQGPIVDIKPTAISVVNASVVTAH